MPEAPARHPAPRLTIFNHKGGVGKTTIIFNVASAMAAAGKRVLLIDSDPQCNLTASIVEESVVDDLLDHSDEDAGATLWSAVKPIVEGTGSLKLIPPIAVQDRLFLLPGDIRLAEFEQELDSLWAECFQRKPRGFRGTTALSSLVNVTAAAYGIDVVFYDCGPNIGALNRVILLDCDAFAIPASYDLFSIRAVKTLGHTLVGWIRGWETIGELAPDGLYLLPGKPAFLGYIPQRYRVYGRQPSKQFAKFVPMLERRIQSDLVSVLSQVDKDLILPTAIRDYKLGEVKDFGSLANESQRLGVWIPAVDGGTPDQKEEARQAFVALSTAIFDRLGNRKTLYDGRPAAS